jgi:hypothetical protein
MTFLSGTTGVIAAENIDITSSLKLLLVILVDYFYSLIFFLFFLSFFLSFFSF